MEAIRFYTENEFVKDLGTCARKVDDLERELSQNEYGDLEDCIGNIICDGHFGWPVDFGKGECDIFFTCEEDGETYDGKAHVEYEVEDQTFDHAFGRQREWGFTFDVTEAYLYNC